MGLRPVLATVEQVIFQVCSWFLLYFLSSDDEYLLMKSDLYEARHDTKTTHCNDGTGNNTSGVSYVQFSRVKLDSTWWTAAAKNRIK